MPLFPTTSQCHAEYNTSLILTSHQSFSIEKADEDRRRRIPGFYRRNSGMCSAGSAYGRKIATNTGELTPVTRQKRGLVQVRKEAFMHRFR
jgi:hypothetical protein